MLWKIIGSITLLLFIRKDWNLPESLQIPRTFLEEIPGWPSFYGHKQSFDLVAESWSSFWDFNLDQETSEEEKSSNDLPFCSLTSSSVFLCRLISSFNCSVNEDYRCSSGWIHQNRSVLCERETKQSTNCDLKKSVQKVSLNKTHIILTLTDIPKEISIEKEKKSFENANGEKIRIFPKKNVSFSLTTNTNYVFYENLEQIQEQIRNQTFCLNGNCLETEFVQDEQDNHVEIALLKVDGEFIVQIKNMDSSNPGSIKIEMIPKIIDTKTTLFWRKPGRFDCPTEVTCPRELIYLWRSDNVKSILITSIMLLICCWYLSKRSKH